MLNKEKQLLCTFTTDQEYRNIISKIFDFYTVLDSKIFVFKNAKITKEYFLTYNIDCHKSYGSKFPNTISIHRKKNYNTLYTLNAMNRLIADENNGVFDKTFQVNWELYKNSLILITDIGIKVVGLTLIDIITH